MINRVMRKLTFCICEYKGADLRQADNSIGCHTVVVMGPLYSSRHFSLLNVKFAGACGYDFVCDGRRLVRAYLRRRRGAI